MLSFLALIYQELVVQLLYQIQETRFGPRVTRSMGSNGCLSGANKQVYCLAQAIGMGVLEPASGSLDHGSHDEGPQESRKMGMHF